MSQDKCCIGKENIQKKTKQNEKRCTSLKITSESEVSLKTISQ